MVIVYHKMTVEAENVQEEEDVNVQEPRDKVGDQEKDEAQLTEAQIPFQKPEAQLTRFGDKIKNKTRKSGTAKNTKRKKIMKKRPTV